MVDSIVYSYLNEISTYKILSLPEEKELVKRIQAGDKQALNTLIEANLKFVVSVCRKYQQKGLPLGDLINEGNLGLIQAAHRFDASQNFKFISYAVWWIRQAILTALAEQSRALTVSSGRATLIYKMDKTSSQLEQKLGRQPSLDHVAEEMEISCRQLSDCLQLSYPPISLNAALPGNDAGTYEECLEDESGVPTDESSRQYFLHHEIENLLETLDEREKEVIQYYYGIGLETAYSMDEIANIFHLSRERIRQIKEKALQRLQHPSRKVQLEAW